MTGAPPGSPSTKSRLGSRASRFRYVNVEEGLGQTTRQKELLDWMERRLKPGRSLT